MSMEHGQNSRKLPLDNNLLGTMVPYDDDDGGIQSAGAGGYEY